ncbi:TniB family NTP-binding protein [Rhizobium rhizogenes]|uniref:TniB family NTP-binding protein n=1 Tax=Rhizobium rhizogenes TaxID=359 RepID=UPI001573600F|nr:TniB family NTP-binding protein [Rhizobium rhizogenes]NTG64718.1 AAA family ATPase [Rhizobium rhizogenes]NTH68441.1 AAA family ATPase [Rhizobium rhizogenes]NTH99920.1 AAA family ATPase [Rhizobium rhizogenes]NTI39070.1 AAA family ATPase [Rhizobium rhizogenes]NTJ18212.1 AAA family ATPase [Rhizobium rhizogenes]
MSDGKDHLSPPARVIADLPPLERLARMKEQWWINHPRAQATLDKLEAALTFGPGRIRPPNILIVGPTNNGKTMVAEKFRRMHPPKMSTSGDHEVIPVLIMQMPTEPSVRRFYSAALHALNAPVCYNNSGERLERHTLDLLRTVQTRMLIIDELHNILSGSHRRRAEFLNMLRFLGNTLRIPVIGLGTKNAQIAIRSDDQLENRFEPVPLPVWEDNTEFARLLSSFERALPLREPSTLAAMPELRSLILRRSSGLIGEVAAMLTSAASFALMHGQERINHSILDRCNFRGPDERRAIFEASFSRVR